MFHTNRNDFSSIHPNVCGQKSLRSTCSASNPVVPLNVSKVCSNVPITFDLQLTVSCLSFDR